MHLGIATQQSLLVFEVLPQGQMQMNQSETGLIVILSAALALPAFGHKPGEPLKPRFNLYSKQQDIEVGKEAAAQVRQRYQQVQNRDLQAYVKTLGNRLASISTSPR